MYKSKARIIAIIAAILMLTVGCGDKNPAGHEDEVYDISYTYTPTPAVKDAAITFTFKVEHDADHIGGLTGTAVEFEMPGMAPEEIDLTEDSADPGHYEGTITFTMVGEYEVHFHYLHDGEETHVELTTALTVN